MKYSDIAYWDGEARANWTYLPDSGPDEWRDHSTDVLSGLHWADDCDGLAMTTVALCVRAGLPRECAYRGIVEASDGSGLHMVGYTQDDEGSWWVVGDTFFPGPYSAGQMQHAPIRYNCMAEAGPGLEPVWRLGVPWKA